MVLEIIIPVATGVVGAVAGLGIALFMKHEGKSFPVPEEKDVWEHLLEKTKERAEINARHKALQEALKSGAITTESYSIKGDYPCSDDTSKRVGYFQSIPNSLTALLDSPMTDLNKRVVRTVSGA